MSSEQASKQANKQTNIQTNKQTHKQTNKQASKQTNKARAQFRTTEVAETRARAHLTRQTSSESSCFEPELEREHSLFERKWRRLERERCQEQPGAAQEQGGSPSKRLWVKGSNILEAPSSARACWRQAWLIYHP